MFVYFLVQFWEYHLRLNSMLTRILWSLFLLLICRLLRVLSQGQRATRHWELCFLRILRCTNKSTIMSKHCQVKPTSYTALLDRLWVKINILQMEAANFWSQTCQQHNSYLSTYKFSEMFETQRGNCFIYLLISGDFCLVIPVVLADLLTQCAEGFCVVFVHFLLALFVLPKLKRKS